MSAFVGQVAEEISIIAPSMYRDSVRWYDNTSMIYNNIRYAVDWMDARLASMNQWLA